MGIRRQDRSPKLQRCCKPLRVRSPSYPITGSATAPHSISLKLNLDVPVIIATGAGSEQIAVQAMKAGAYDYLIKDHERDYLKVLQVTVEGSLKQKRTEERVKIQSDRESAKRSSSGPMKAWRRSSDL